jgi:Fe-S-cluster containining protein
MPESPDAPEFDDHTDPFDPDVPPGHQVDEDGFHEPDECYQCLLAKDPTQSSCRCGKCCRSLLIEVLLEDAEREPRIKELGSPTYTDARLTQSGQPEIEGYMLNSSANDYACAFLDRQTNLCSIYETRPLVCRLFDCDEKNREDLIELGIISRDDEE